MNMTWTKYKINMKEKNCYFGKAWKSSLRCGRSRLVMKSIRIKCWVLKLKAPEVPDFQSVLLKLDKKKKKKRHWICLDF